MTILDALELVGAGEIQKPYTKQEVMHGEFSDRLSEAIATIPNAVVKGELK